MTDGLGEKERDRLQEMLIQFCAIILTDKERIAESDLDSFFKSLNGDDIALFNKASELIELNHDSQIVKFTVQSCIMDYVQNFQDVEKIGDTRNLRPPFEFDSGDGFDDFKNIFADKYRALTNGAKVPTVFDMAFRCIQRVSEQYRYFEQFYTIRFQQTQGQTLTSTKKYIDETVSSFVAQNVYDNVQQIADDAAEEATRQASIQAEQARFQAELASESARTAKEKAEKAVIDVVEDAVNKQMTAVTRHISETTVTVLGIFSAIVLTVIGGFIYSASVISSANETNYFKLVSMTALVGLVCFNLLLLMFHYIFKIRGNVTEITKNWIVIVTNIILGIVMIASGFMYFFVPVPDDGNCRDATPTEAVTETQTDNATSDTVYFDVSETP